MEFRGHGKSEGTPNEEDFYRDVKSAHLHLINKQGVNPRNIISFGQSLGNAMAANLASEAEVGSVVMEAPFLSVGRVVCKVFWFMPALELMVRSQLDTENKLRKIKARILIVQSSEDPVIPPERGREVSDATPLPKEML